MSSGFNPFRSISPFAAFAPIVTMSSYTSGNEELLSPSPFVYFSGSSPFSGANVPGKSSLSFPVQISTASMPTSVMNGSSDGQHMALSMVGYVDRGTIRRRTRSSDRIEGRTGRGDGPAVARDPDRSVTGAEQLGRSRRRPLGSRPRRPRRKCRYRRLTPRRAPVRRSSR